MNLTSNISEKTPQYIARKYLSKPLKSIYQLLYQFCADNHEVSNFLADQDYITFLSGQLAIYRHEVGELIKEIVNNTMGYGNVDEAI